MSPLPAMFLSHGTPMFAFAEPEDDPCAAAIQGFARRLERPRAIVVVSAHGVSDSELIEVSIGHRCELEYDFQGFPRALYELEYPCPGDPDLSAQVSLLLGQAGLKASLNPTMRLDHGVWVPLKVLFPEADIPVIQLTMPWPLDGRKVLKMGKALASLRSQGVLLIGSGGAVHNLSLLQWSAKGAPEPEWASKFEAWVIEQLDRKNVEGLLQFEEEAPGVELAHPTPEHFLPIFFALGASLAGDEAVPVYQGMQYGSLSMLSFTLEQPGK